ncbi:hypothetical protein [Streptomyces sp. NPDC004014]
MNVHKRIALAAAAATLSAGLAGTVPAQAAQRPVPTVQAASGFQNWSCGYNHGKGLEPHPLAHATRAHKLPVGPTLIELRNAKSHGTWFAWARVNAGIDAATEPGTEVWFDWSDDHGRTYHACGSPYHKVMLDAGVAQREDGPVFQAHTKAVNWIRGRWVKICGAYWRMHSNGVPYVAKTACSGWYAS